MTMVKPVLLSLCHSTVYSQMVYSWGSLTVTYSSYNRLTIFPIDHKGTLMRSHRNSTHTCPPNTVTAAYQDCARHIIPAAVTTVPPTSIGSCGIENGSDQLLVVGYPVCHTTRVAVQFKQTSNKHRISYICFRYRCGR